MIKKIRINQKNKLLILLVNIALFRIIVFIGVQLMTACLEAIQRLVLYTVFEKIGKIGYDNVTS